MGAALWLPRVIKVQHACTRLKKNSARQTNKAYPILSSYVQLWLPRVIYVQQACMRLTANSVRQTNKSSLIASPLQIHTLSTACLFDFQHVPIQLSYCATSCSPITILPAWQYRNGFGCQVNQDICSVWICADKMVNDGENPGSNRVVVEYIDGTG